MGGAAVTKTLKLELAWNRVKGAGWIVRGYSGEVSRKS
jgi:hypothetical protein